MSLDHPSSSDRLQKITLVEEQLLVEEEQLSVEEEQLSVEVGQLSVEVGQHSEATALESQKHSGSLDGASTSTQSHPSKTSVLLPYRVPHQL